LKRKRSELAGQIVDLRRQRRFSATKSGLEFIMERIAALRSRCELLKLALTIVFAAAVLGSVGVEAFWRYVPAHSAP
jgi:hypothetical protein